MRLSLKPFSGRVIFDHIPKTAGQAVANWLRDELGDGTVSPNMVASHKDVLNRSYEYPIVTGHVFFEDGEGFEPRFEYVTLLREPVDRTLSWLFFVTRNHSRDDLPQLYDECQAFLASEGDDLQPYLAEAIANPMVAHYAQILGAKNLTGSELVDAAFRAVQSYDCIGTYERLPEFVGELARFLGIVAPESLQSSNVTRERPKADAISEKFRDNILAITDLDRELYERVAQLASSRLEIRGAGPSVSRWARYDRPVPSVRSASSFELLSVNPSQEIHASIGDSVNFELEFDLREPVNVLLAGILIYDDRKKCAFGVNNYLLGNPFEKVVPGRYRAIHSITMNLPAGSYAADFTFVDLSDGKPQKIFHHPELLAVVIHRGAEPAGVGYSPCAAEVRLESLPDSSPDDAIDSSSKEDQGQIAA